MHQRVGSDDAELTGPIYSGGMGVAIREGVGLAAGYSVYDMKIVATNDEKMRKSLTVGVTLDAELWNALFGSK